MRGSAHTSRSEKAFQSDQSNKNIGARQLRFLNCLQHSLQQRYDVDIPYSIGDFVCPFSGPQTKPPGSELSEMLIYREDGDNLDVSLILDAGLLAGINPEQFRTCWCDNTFSNRCILLEGVSHFLYLVWNAHYDRQLSMFDLELQAEIDKFIFTVLDTDYNDSVNRLIERLFLQVCYRRELSPNLRHRYEKANQLAHVYCQWLQNNFNLQSPCRELSAELARFYRLNGEAKRQHISSCLY